MANILRRVDQRQPALVGPWARGIVNTISDHALPVDALRDARDYDIGREGFVSARSGYTLLSDDDAFRHLFEHNEIHYAVSQGHVGVLGTDAFTTIHPVVGSVGWGVLDDEPVFCDITGVYQVRGMAAVQLTLRPTIEEEDRYGLTDLPGGRAVAYWQGRLLVLRGRSLLWSEALDYGSHSPARNFVRFASSPTWMAPLLGGIFVGLSDTVMWLDGTNPAEFQARTVAGLNCPGAAMVVDSKQFSPELGVAGPVAVWFSDVGFVVGSGDGRVVYPQAGNLRGIPVVPRNLALIDDRIYAFATED